MVDKSELEGTYTARLIKQLKVLLMSAGYAGSNTPYDRFVWQQQFVQGLQLMTWQIISQQWPAEFEQIVNSLLPGMLKLLAQVEARGRHQISKEEARVSAHVYTALFFMAAFLQNSAWFFYKHPDSPVYTDLPLFRQEWFRQWHC